MIAKKRLNSIAVLAILAILSIITLFPLAHGQSNTPNVMISLNGPSVVGTLRTGTYSATLVDIENREWDYKVYISSSSNLSGASPIFTSPINGTVTPENNTFAFDITAPQAQGYVEIHINCTSGNYYYNKVHKIYVVTPISFTVDVNNPTNVEIRNATVQFFVNDFEIDEQVISSIGAGESTRISSEWISKDKNPGWHSSKIIIDINGDGIIDTNVGDMVIEDRFYIEGNTDWVFALTVLVGLTALLIGFGYISKRKIK